jgi:NAD+ synthase (glutamine-hydrolysing)
MRWAIAQIDSTIGDLAGNSERIASAARRAAEAGASLLVVPEMALLGYPPRDLLLREGVAGACVEAAAALAAAFPGITMLLGLPRRVAGDLRPFRNSAALCRGGRIEAFADKQLLPTYDVFDEDRYFTPAPEGLIFEQDGLKVGVAICEDLWRALDARGARSYPRDPIADLAAAGCKVVLSPGASPFVRGKYEGRIGLLRQIARGSGMAVVQVNLVGASDDLVFDGGSAAFSAAGECLGCLPRFEEGFMLLSPAGPSATAPAIDAPEEETFRALVAGIRGYFRKTGHARALLGLSGGIDSAVVAALAAAALGPGQVAGVLLPSRFSSEGSRRDAIESAARLRLAAPREIPIEGPHAALAAAAATAAPIEGLADENLQSRIRGTLLMAVANSEGSLLLTTGNKSEIATGYCTLYGDMSGALGPIGDLLKTEVYSLARWMNEHHARLGFAGPPVPPSSIEKAPSAELRADQRDQDTLPPYEQLDALIEAAVEQERDETAAAAAAGMPLEEARRWLRLIDLAEFKRHQAAPVLKVKPRSFGRGRPMPLAASWRPGPAGER